jgi:hypothetical protein
MVIPLSSERILREKSSVGGLVDCTNTEPQKYEQNSSMINTTLHTDPSGGDGPPPVNKPMSSKKKTRVENEVEGERRKDDILSRIIQLERSLGGLAPGLLDMFCAGFEPEEIAAVQSELEWLYGPRWDRQGPVNLETLQTYEALQVYDQRQPSHSSVI